MMSRGPLSQGRAEVAEVRCEAGAVPQLYPGAFPGARSTASAREP